MMGTFDTKFSPPLQISLALSPRSLVHPVVNADLNADATLDSSGLMPRIDMRVCTCPSSEQLLALFVNEVSFSPGFATFDVQCIQRSAPAEGRGQRCTPLYSTISVLNLQFLIRFIALKQCYKTTSKRKCEGRQPSAGLHASRIQAKALSKCLCSLSSIRAFRGFDC